MQKLYDLGGRRVIVTGTGPMGCAPAELAMRGKNGECSAELQRAAALYNPRLEQMIVELNNKIGSVIFIAANTAQMHNDFITNPQAFGNYFLIFSFKCLVHLSDKVTKLRSSYMNSGYFWKIFFPTIFYSL